MFELNRQDQQEAPPSCYGKSWNPKDVLCAGGADALYRDEKTGSHVRPQCDFYSSCGSRVSHMRMEQSRLLPVTNLIRQSPPPQATIQTPAPQPPANWNMTQAQMQQYMTDQAKAMAQQMFNQMQQQQPNRFQTSNFNQATFPSQGGTQFDPRFQNFQPMPVNFQMPAYLTVPENPMAGGSMWGMLFRSIARSMMKAFGHSFSHFFDSVPMGRPPGNGQ